MSTRDHPDWWRPVGGQNSQDSTLERRSTLWNDGGPTPPAAPSFTYTGAKDRGKFFTRGCRGKIDLLRIYCIRTAAGTLDLSFSPHPCLGPLYTITITPGAAWDWAQTVFQEMWNYDSLFIWVSRCDVDVSWGYDDVQPWDGHRTFDGGVTWQRIGQRPYIQARYDGETPGDVPVSGVVNTIPIPNVGLEGAGVAGINVPNAGWTNLCTVDGAGTLIQARVIFWSVVVPAAGVTYQLAVQADGQAVIIVDNLQLTQSVVATSGRCAIGEFIQTAASTRLWVRLPVEYRRTLLLRAFQSTGAAVNTDGAIAVNELI